jgi:hypothetical protein
MTQADGPAVTFRCPPELRRLIPEPIPAVLGLPDWYKTLPQRALNTTLGSETETLKRCPPFIDAMTYGFLIPLVTDLKVQDGEFTWNLNFPQNSVGDYPRSPISFHDPGQIAGTPFFDTDRFIIKFNNFWLIEAPPGYSLLFTHPINRPELPFTALSGLVDCDTFNHTLVHFPVRWHDASFNGVLPKGTPIVQCLPVKRENWTGWFEELSDEAAARLARTGQAIAQTPNLYRREFRAPKR